MDSRLRGNDWILSPPRKRRSTSVQNEMNNAEVYLFVRVIINRLMQLSLLILTLKCRREPLGYSAEGRDGQHARD
jgi:hypothetical protein